MTFFTSVAIARSYFSSPIRFDAAVLHHDGKILPPSVVDPDGVLVHSAILGKLRGLVGQGRCGVKSGRGFYEYPDAS